jgi:hypothetical protein
MPMSPADTERKIQQLDGDVQAIYEMLGAIDGTLRRQRNRLEEIAAEITSVDARLDAKIDSVHDRLDAKIENVHDKLDAKIDSVHDRLDAKIDRILELLGSTRTD